MTMEFSTATVAGIIGATVRQVDHWARKGVLTPSGHDAAGKGSKRRWRFPDVVALQAIRELRVGGCPLPMIQKVVSHLKAHYPHQTPSEALSRVKLFAYAGRVFMVNDDDRAMDVLSRQTMFSLPIGSLILETRRRVEAVPLKWEEKALISGRAFHLDVSRAGPSNAYVARCRELPGAVTQAAAAEEAVARLKEAVAEVLALASTAAKGERVRVQSRRSPSGSGRRSVS